MKEVGEEEAAPPTINGAHMMMTTMMMPISKKQQQQQQQSNTLKDIVLPLPTSTFAFVRRIAFCIIDRIHVIVPLAPWFVVFVEVDDDGNAVLGGSSYGDDYAGDYDDDIDFVRIDIPMGQ